MVSAMWLDTAAEILNEQRNHLLEVYFIIMSGVLIIVQETYSEKSSVMTFIYKHIFLNLPYLV